MDIAGHRIAVAIALACCWSSRSVDAATTTISPDQVEAIIPASGPNPYDAGGHASVVDGVVSMELPVDVVLIGYPRETAAALANALVPMPIEQIEYVYPRLFSGPPVPPGRFRPTAFFRVHLAPQWLADGYERALVPAADGKAWDGNLAEAWLRRQLARAGFVTPFARPALVLLHPAPTGHTYAYRGDNGSLSSVRTFGAGPMLFMDLGAAPDPWVTASGSPHAYDAPIATEGDAAVTALKAVAMDAASFRLAQGPLYRSSMASCHAVTVLLARRKTAVTDLVTGSPGLPFDTRRIAAAYARVLGDPVFLDIKELTLPADDPPLDVLTRTISSYRVGTNPDLETALREWVEVNWDKYHVNHEGCEPYLHISLYGDFADYYGLSMAQFDPNFGHRYSYGVIGEMCRGPVREMGFWIGVMGIGVGCGSHPADEAYRYPDYLAIHEVGHLLGLRHPHDIDVDSGYQVNWSFSSAMSSMAYQSGDRVLSFGAIDAANLQRNRAAAALWMAQRAGRERSPKFAHALRAMGAYHWNEVVRTLR